MNQPRVNVKELDLMTLLPLSVMIVEYLMELVVFPVQLVIEMIVEVLMDRVVLVVCSV